MVLSLMADELRRDPGLQPCVGGHVAAPDDANDVLCALRLGWFLAESRGRNRPGGQLGVKTSLPDHVDHALPLRVERGPTELRIEAQKVVAQLAVDLHVDTDSDGTSFAKAMNDKAKTLNPVRAPKASAALQWALGQLRMAAAGRSYPGDSAPPTPQQAIQTLQAAVDPQQQAVTAATARGDQAAAAGEQRGLDALHTALAALQATNDGDAGAAQARVAAVRESLQVIAVAANDPWEDLAQLLWRFDAHIQDRLSATSETQACGYQLGRGLAETYWALDPGEAMGSASWNFLLGKSRCGELSRMVGRLGSCWGEYTAPAIAGSVEVWEDVVKTPGWLGSPTTHSQQCLYSQTRRWYELIILGQDPTTLISPGALMKDYRTIGRALKLFWPQLAGIVFGLAFLAALLVLI